MALTQEQIDSLQNETIISECESGIIEESYDKPHKLIEKYRGWYLVQYMYFYDGALNSYATLHLDEAVNLYDSIHISY